ISKLRQAFPGCQIEIVDAYDLAPAAASKGVQKARGMVEAIWDALSKTGTVTREAIANLLKLSPGRISQLAALVCGKTFSQLVDALVFLYKAIKGKTNALEIDEDLRYLAETFLPDLARDLENLARPELIEDVLVGVCAVCSYEPEMVHRILAATPVWALCKLFGGAMQVAIGRLLSISPPMPEVLERTG
ncbi:MAG TPA: hypothetical protein VK203_13305, partial [Nostocaceae cyanobacterium]|nr:hypothetical protein [Nostocaceae cyanobacterium]